VPAVPRPVEFLIGERGYRAALRLPVLPPDVAAALYGAVWRDDGVLVRASRDTAETIFLELSAGLRVTRRRDDREALEDVCDRLEAALRVRPVHGAPQPEQPPAGPAPTPRAAARAVQPQASAARPTWVEVDLDRIRHNVATLRAAIGPDCRLMAVVKAGAYGHGAGPVARAALEAGATALGVALVEEGVELRRAGIAAPILVLGWTPPERAAEVVAAGLEQTVVDVDEARAFAAAARAAGRRVRLHAKVDTGMGRLGWPCRAPEDVEPAAAAIALVAGLRGVELAGVFTHFADADGWDLAATREQLGWFHTLLDALRARGVEPALRHCANTAAMLRLPEARLDLCRAGIGVYGYLPSRFVPDPGLLPALSWYTRVAQVRELRAGEAVGYGGTYRARTRERVATLPVGYADGFPRSLSNRGFVWIKGVRAPVRGRVCMDQTVVGVDGCGQVQPGDIAVLLGEGWGADRFAELLGTIAYEVLCGIGARVPRVYVES
jgi:alanine racemase